MSFFPMFCQMSCRLFPKGVGGGVGESGVESHEDGVGCLDGWSLDGHVRDVLMAY